jgi:histidinol-phosphate aminotransferase
MCSPNNPTGNNLDINEMAKVITQFEGLVVVDEAYIDFSQQKSLRQAVLKCPNLIVLHTMSKAWGHAAIRLGMAFASEDIVTIMNKVKYPYNINTLTQQQAISALRDQEQTDKQVKFLIQERQRMSAAIRMLPLCENVYPSDANFLLVKTLNAQSIYDTLVKRGIIVRNRHKITLCDNCLRITIGTKTENNELLAALRDIRG